MATRDDLARELSGLREGAGTTVRSIADRADVRLATVGGWFSGKHVPTSGYEDAFRRVLAACGVPGPDHDLWWDAVLRARRSTARRPASVATPYRGLAAFGPDDAPWFHGREEEIDTLLDRVRSGPRGVLAVIGASGAGKSSVLAAGLVARVRRGDLGDRTIETITPGRYAALPPFDPAPDILVVDQAEELWGADVDAMARRRFLDRVGSSAATVVVAIRADFYASALTEPLLMAALSADPVVIGPLDEERLRRVVTAPAEAAGGRVEPALVEILLAEVTVDSRGMRPSLLPLLSHALLATWERARSTTMTVEDYRATGGIAGAVEQSAEVVFARFDDSARRVAERLLLRLVDVDGDIVTRRTVVRAEVGEGTDVVAVVDDFARARLLTVVEDKVEITHESLVTTWSRFSEWVDAHRDWVAHHRTMTHFVRAWDEGGRDRAELLGESRSAFYDDLLGIGDRRAHLNPMEHTYLAESEENVQRVRRARLRRARVRTALTSGLAVMTVVAVSAAVLAVSARSRAVDERNDAVRAREIADARVVLAQSRELRDRDPSVSAQLAVAAYAIDPTFDTRSAVLDASALPFPTRIVGSPGPTLSVIAETKPVLAVGYSSGTVDLFADARSGSQTPTSRLTTADGPVGALALDDTGTVLAIGEAFGVTVYDVSRTDSPRRLASLTTDASVESAQFGPGGDELVLGTTSSTVLRWVHARDAPPVVSTIQDASDTKVAYSPDGRFVVGGGNGRTVTVWDTAKGNVVFSVPYDGSTYRYLDFAFSPDGRTLAAGTTGREVRRWSVEPDGKLTDRPSLGGFASYATAVAFAADGSTIAATGADNLSLVWDAATDTPLMTLPGPVGVGSVAFAGSDTVVTSDVGGVTRLWPVPGPSRLAGGDTVFTLPAARGGSVVLAGVGSRGAGATLWRIDDIARTRLDNRVLPTPAVLSPREGGALTGATAMSRDGAMAALGTTTGGVDLWNVADPAEPVRLGSVDGVVPLLVGAVGFTPDARHVVVAQQDASGAAFLDVTDPGAPRTVSQFDVGGLPVTLTFHPELPLLYIATSSATLEVWDTGDPARPVRTALVGGFDAAVNAVAVSPDGAVVAAGTSNGAITLFDATDPVALREIGRTRADAEVMSLGFDSTGSRLIAGTGTEALWMWDVADPTSPQPSAALTASGKRINDAAFVGAGDLIVGAGAERVLRQWRADPDDVVTAVCAESGTPISEQEWDRLVPGVTFRQPCA